MVSIILSLWYFRHTANWKGKNALPGVDASDAYEYSRQAVQDPRVSSLFQGWVDSVKLPFYGVTADGVKVENLYGLKDHGAPTLAATTAAHRLLDELTPEETLRAVRELDSEDRLVPPAYYVAKADGGVGESGATLRSLLLTLGSGWKISSSQKLILCGH